METDLRTTDGPQTAVVRSALKGRTVLSVRVPAALRAEVKAEAAIRGMTMEAAVQEALSDWLAKFAPWMPEPDASNPES